MSPSQRLYAWTQAVAGMWPGREAGEPSAAEDTPPCSADSGLCCESDSEPGTSLSEAVTPDAWTPAFWAELEPEAGLGSPAASQAPPQLGSPTDAVAEHGRWLAACIQALGREVTEEEMARVDGAVDNLVPWQMFTGRLPAPRRDLGGSTDGAGLRQVLGHKLSALRKRLSAHKVSREGSSPCRGKAEDS